MLNLKDYDVIIIGGGAAGFAAASFLREKSVLIIESSRTMHKLAITGKGRCNLTNNCDMETLLANIPKNPLFLRSALTRFTPQDAMAWFEALGVPLKTERGGRVFPVSDKAGEVVEALRRANNAKIVTDRAVELIDGGVRCEKSTYHAPKIILATGGMSYPATGSTGDGYELARKAGHTITPLKPALVPLETVENVSELAGLTLKNVKLTLGKFEAKGAGFPCPAERAVGRAEFNEIGELLFTHFGVTGPLILSASWFAKSGDVISIDLKPALDEKTLDARILRDFAENKNRQFKNALGKLLPESLIEIFVKRSGISPDTPVNSITKIQRQKLLRLFKGFTLTVKALRPLEEAVITDGGVCVKEIDPKTMASKLVCGLYFAGEIIDVAGFTGGYNLQIAWATAKAAALTE